MFTNIQIFFDNSKNLLKKDGRLVVVSFHSLEDRIVKEFFKANSNSEKINKYNNTLEEKNFTFKLIEKQPVIVSEEEVKSNVRSRSAKLRWGIKC